DEMRLTEKPEIVTWPETHYLYIEKSGPFQDTAGSAWKTLHQLVPKILERNKITGYMSLYKIAPAMIYRAGVAVSAKPTEIRSYLRDCVATLAYRGGKALRGAPAGFSEFRISGTTLSSGEILAHMGDLLDWALSMAKGKQEWFDSKPLPWDRGVERFFTALQAFDAYIASGAPLHAPAEKLFQGPIADALTHV